MDYPRCFSGKKNFVLHLLGQTRRTNCLRLFGKKKKVSFEEFD
jgi:hypothetical protein